MSTIVAPERHHPAWYYEAFSLLFSVSRDYAAEAEAISEHASVRGAVVEEIGAGRGDHAAALLRLVPEHMTLLDWDGRAVAILEHRFGMRQDVTIVNADGFDRADGRGADTVLAMQSIVQEATAVAQVISRLSAVGRRLNACGSFVFEIVDVAVSRDLYANGVPTEIYRSGADVLSIATTYGADTMTIRYRGAFHGASIEYDVPLLPLTAGNIPEVVDAAELRVRAIRSLDRAGRRLLITAQRR